MCPDSSRINEQEAAAPAKPRGETVVNLRPNNPGADLLVSAEVDDVCSFRIDIIKDRQELGPV